jgi:hypothetical protein
LLTVILSMTHATRKHEYSNGSSTGQESYTSKSGIGKDHVFLHFSLSYSLRSRSITLFSEELTGVKVLDVYLYNLSSIKTK